MDEYLRTDIRVPATQIVDLRDNNATRDGILRELRALSEHADIRKGCHVLVFYAGYGAAADAPEGWDAEGKKISTIMPHDGLVNPNNGGRVHPIPDRTMNALLRNLSERVGEDGNVVSTLAIRSLCLCSDLQLDGHS